MKFVILVICALLQFPTQNSAQNKGKHDEAWKSCSEGFSKEDIESLFVKGKEPTNDRLRCVPKCVLTRLGFMDESNTLNYESMVKEVLEGTTEEQRRVVVDNCKQAVDSDGCKVALAFMRCAVDKIKNW